MTLLAASGSAPGPLLDLHRTRKKSSADRYFASPGRTVAPPAECGSGYAKSEPPSFDPHICVFSLFIASGPRRGRCPPARENSLLAPRSPCARRRHARGSSGASCWRRRRAAPLPAEVARARAPHPNALALSDHAPLPSSVPPPARGEGAGMDPPARGGRREEGAPPLALGGGGRRGRRHGSASARGE